MSLPHHIRILAVVLGLVGAGTATIPAGASDQVLVAPFECGTEWSGTTYPGHGHDNLNLDFNRTSLTWPDDGHDLGQPILAQGNGTVVWFEQDGWNNGAGAYLEIDYGAITVRYVHLVDHSIPDHLDQIGATVSTGELIALLGGTGNATHPHLHLEYWDSADYVDAPRWRLPSANHIQITMAGEPIDPGEAFVSTNCDGPPPPSPPDPLLPFIDVPTNSFAYDDVALIASLGLTTGTSPTTYDPYLDVTREQMAAFLARLWLLIDDGRTELPDPLPQPFDDVDALSFAHDHIALLAYLEITTGTTATTYDGADPVTREQMAAFLARLWLLIDGGRTELPDPLPQPFDDVDALSFAHDHIALLAYLEITTGTTATTYDGADPVTREQMAAFLARLWRLVAPDEPES